MLPDGMESLDALVWLEGCLALRRPLAMAAWSAEMYCRQLDARFGPPPDHNGSEPKGRSDRGSGHASAGAAVPQASELTRQCLSIIR